MPEPYSPSQPIPHPLSLQQRGELPLLRICNRHADAVIALQGAQLLEYRPRGDKPVLWLSDRASYQRGHSVRGGVPVCWPWFGAFERNPANVRAMTADNSAPPPAHGLVRSCDWTLHSLRDSDDCTEVTLQLRSDTLQPSLWPQTALLQLTIGVGATLTMALTTHNLGDTPLALTQALHTYLAVSAIEQVRLSGFETARYIDTLDDWREKTQRTAITFNGETDRIYLDVPHAVQLHDDGWQRTITLRASGSSSAVVWNPWIEKSQRLSQFRADAWRDMVCIETANVLSNAIELAPQTSHTLALEIDSRPAKLSR